MKVDLDSIKSTYAVSGVVAAAGVHLTRTRTEFKACCPFHQDRSPSFTIFAGDRRWYCFGCGAQGDVLDFICRLHGIGLREAAERITGETIEPICPPPAPIERTDTVPAARAIWDSAAPIAGTLAEQYLRHRRIHIRLPDALRFAQLRYGSRGPDYPVLLAAVTDVSSAITGIQRTYLAPDGRGKLAVTKPKLSLGRVAGGAIRLAPCAASLVVTEGLEDGLTLQQELGLATWVATGASMLPNMKFPAIVTNISVGGDNDEAGRVAARKAAANFVRAGLGVSVFFPTVGTDFNAELMEVRR